MYVDAYNALLYHVLHTCMYGCAQQAVLVHSLSDFFWKVERRVECILCQCCILCVIVFLLFSSPEESRRILADK